MPALLSAAAHIVPAAMPGQRVTFTEEQRQAVVRAVLDEGMTQVGTVRAARAGFYGLEPFRISRATVQSYVEAEVRDRGRGEGKTATVEQLRSDLLAELYVAIRVEIPQLEGEKKLSRIRQAAGALEALEKRNRSKPRPEPDPDEDGEKEGSAPSLDRLRQVASEVNGSSKANGGQVIEHASDEATVSARALDAA